MQNDMISRSAVLLALRKAKEMAYEPPTSFDIYIQKTFDLCIRLVAAFNALDVAPVVRCESCMRRRTFDCPMYSETDGSDYGLDIIINDRTDDDGYCHCGARLDGESDG